jgi:putative FmdB family regulatory protein
MPIFEYACHDCGNAFELLVRTSFAGYVASQLQACTRECGMIEV